MRKRAGARCLLVGAMGGAGMAALMADMSENLDSAEWRMILAALVSALSLSMCICFTVLIKVAWKVHWSWYYLNAFFFVLPARRT